MKKHFTSGLYNTGSKGHVWLANVQCKGKEGDIADCKHKVRALAGGMECSAQWAALASLRAWHQ